ncbi:regulatory protein, Fis family [Amycolatopsis sacchari]|uniref:Regulatory protein, Fis family n=1 Tax=Amycolatopsis sacchari TaxID=115433 RepID=A0A1I3QWS5_9PSEU|nr:helix-turn-helix domain-containing protein [Amycolatopsis sacchari]SFJ38703.1 regulatory protein, Fis family [Amycolatopsis sacchari]
MAHERPVAVPARLRASWQRSERYGVPPDEVQPVFTGTVDEGSLFYECGSEVLRGLHATLANEPVSLMLTDSEGFVLSRLCGDSTILRSLDRVHLAPGFSYAERNAGTNGLGLALADRAPSLVSAEQHYCSGLWGYTCAAAPVLDPATGALLGSVNLTTWSQSSKELLLAVAQAAAGNTAALMMARGSGHAARPAPRGEVFRVYSDRLPEPRLSGAWQDALAEAEGAIARGRVVVVSGEPGVGKTALASAARRAVRPRERVLNARPPAPQDADAWLALWTPELGKPDTCVIISGVDALPVSAAEELAAALSAVPAAVPAPFTLTAEDPAAIPDVLGELADTVVEVPALRYRPDDVEPLARSFAGRSRFTPAAMRALQAYQWPGNVRQLRDVVRQAATRADVIDTRHLAPEVFTGGTRRLTRMEAVERDEIVRCLTQPGASVAKAASLLGMSRATIYRKIAHYDIKVPGRSRHG